MGATMPKGPFAILSKRGRRFQQTLEPFPQLGETVLAGQLAGNISDQILRELMFHQPRRPNQALVHIVEMGQHATVVYTPYNRRGIAGQPVVASMPGRIVWQKYVTALGDTGFAFDRDGKLTDGGYYFDYEVNQRP